MTQYELDGKRVTREEWLAGAPGVTPGQPPACLTDSVFLEGHCNGSQFSGQERVGDLYKKIALARGVNPKGKVYVKGLARFPGDPEAWVSGRGDVKRVAEKYGHEVDGAVKVKGRRAPTYSVDLDEGLVSAEAATIAARTGEPVTEDMKEKIRDKRKPSWAKGKKAKRLI